MGSRTEAINTIIERVTEREGLELVHWEMVGPKNNCILRIDRIFHHLIARLKVAVDFTASAIAEYGDERALPHLHAALRKFRLDEKDSDRNHAVVELRAAIEALGGELDAREQLKVARADWIREREVRRHARG